MFAPCAGLLIELIDNGYANLVTKTREDRFPNRGRNGTWISVGNVQWGTAAPSNCGGKNVSFPAENLVSYDFVQVWSYRECIVCHVSQMIWKKGKKEEGDQNEEMKKEEGENLSFAICFKNIWAKIAFILLIIFFIIIIMCGKRLIKLSSPSLSIFCLYSPIGCRQAGSSLLIVAFRIMGSHIQ